MSEQRVGVNEGSYENPYKFNGKELDVETGYYYYGARYYDPRISNFLSVDPLAEQIELVRFVNTIMGSVATQTKENSEQTGTPYSYCYNNPINLIDPTGMEPKDWVLNGNQWEWNNDINSRDQALEVGYSDYSDGVTNNVYTLYRNTTVTLGPYGTEDWNETEIYNEGRTIQGLIISNDSSSFSFIAANYKSEARYDGFRAGFEASLININVGASLNSKEIGVFASGTGLELRGTVGYNNNAEISGSGRTLTGFIGANVDVSSGQVQVGVYGVLAEYETSLKLKSDNGRWGVSGTVGGAYEAVGLQGGLLVHYNPVNHSFDIGVSVKLAAYLEINADLQVTVPAFR